MEFLKENQEKKTTSKLTSTGKLLIAITGGIGIGISVVCASFVAPAFRRYCLPYVPATNEQIQNVLSCLPKKYNTNSKLLDIGSGDGRIVIATAKTGLESHGVELNPWLVMYSKLLALKTNTKGTKFFTKDLWKFDISSYNYIVIFGVEQMMKDLEIKLIQQGQHKSKIIACRFPLPNLQPIKIIGSGVNTVWLYEIENKLNNKFVDSV